MADLTGRTVPYSGGEPSADEKQTAGLSHLLGFLLLVPLLVWLLKKEQSDYIRR